MSTKNPLTSETSGKSRPSTTRAVVAMVMGLAEIEKQLANVEARRQQVRQIVRQVAKGLKPAAFFFGRGGHGKSYTILGEMDIVADRAWVKHSGGLTAKGLFKVMMDNPDAIHVLEDMEEAYKSQDFADLLRPACDDGSDRERWIKWETDREKSKFVFTGGVIVISNQDISKVNGPLQAVASRFKPVRWELTMNELMATMLRMADDGYIRRGNSLSPKQCREVAEWLCDRMTSGEALAGVDLRFLTQHAYPAYLQFLMGDKSVDWRDILMAMLQGEVNIPEDRDGRNAQLEKIALQVSMMPGKIAHKHARWLEMTGKGKSAYHEHLRRAKMANGMK